MGIVRHCTSSNRHRQRSPNAPVWWLAQSQPLTSLCLAASHTPGSKTRTVGNTSALQRGASDCQAMPVAHLGGTSTADSVTDANVARQCVSRLTRRSHCATIEQNLSSALTCTFSLQSAAIRLVLSHPVEMRKALPREHMAPTCGALAGGADPDAIAAYGTQGAGRSRAGRAAALLLRPWRPYSACTREDHWTCRNAGITTTMCAPKEVSKSVLTMGHRFQFERWLRMTEMEED